MYHVLEMARKGCVCCSCKRNVVCVGRAGSSHIDVPLERSAVLHSRGVRSSEWQQ